MHVRKYTLKNVHPILFTHLKVLPCKECSFVCHSMEWVQCSKCACFHRVCALHWSAVFWAKSYFLQRYCCCNRTRTLPSAVRFGMKVVSVARAKTLPLSFLPPQRSVYMVFIYPRADMVLRVGIVFYQCFMGCVVSVCSINTARCVCVNALDNSTHGQVQLFIQICNAPFFFLDTLEKCSYSYKYITHLSFSWAHWNILRFLNYGMIPCRILTYS